MGKNIRPAFDDLEYRTAPHLVTRWNTNRLPYVLARPQIGAVYTKTPGGGEAETNWPNQECTLEAFRIGRLTEPKIAFHRR